MCCFVITQRLHQSSTGCVNIQAVHTSSSSESVEQSASTLLGPHHCVALSSRKGKGAPQVSRYIKLTVLLNLINQNPNLNYHHIRTTLRHALTIAPSCHPTSPLYQSDCCSTCPVLNLANVARLCQAQIRWKDLICKFTTTTETRPCSFPVHANRPCHR